MTAQRPFQYTISALLIATLATGIALGVFRQIGFRFIAVVIIGLPFLAVVLDAFHRKRMAWALTALVVGCVAIALMAAALVAAIHGR